MKKLFLFFLLNISSLYGMARIERPEGGPPLFILLYESTGNPGAPQRIVILPFQAVLDGAVPEPQPEQNIPTLRMLDTESCCRSESVRQACIELSLALCVEPQPEGCFSFLKRRCCPPDTEPRH
jgi:hypothetical protein